ncbi:ABC transporter permease [Aliifodinibius sp. S!AR15-10]|uniref:ABC transporter permease n=1 Tax=Aliifodinibius sp. S!AR15-10 TaxID=2950437 RepID=UPI00285891BE|nr:FtsX-like permease family protein [Aliifodinibius sp. S!AR15-10]MDR8394466.1 ABC transporter permease [Aliifodinibius sp. S!AR15-10]
MFARIIKLGWKNVWRNPTRSGVVIIAVLLGVWAGVFISAFMNGMAQGYLQNQLNLTVGHIQITEPRFEDQFNPQYKIPSADSIINILNEKPYVTEIRPQSMSTGLAQSAANSYGVSIHGISTEAESTTPIREYITDGEMLQGVSRNPVVIGNELAERLDIELKSRMVLSFQDVNGEITAGAFRVAGIFDSPNNNYDEGNVFVAQQDLNNLLGKQDMIHKITLKVDDFGQAAIYSQELSGQLKNLKVTSWGDIAPELRYVYSMMDVSLYIFMVIIVIALVFSIINTMLMAILERTRELGMLMAVGMNKTRLFMMILSETVFLTMTGAPLGLLLSWGSLAIMDDTGINLSAFAEGLNEYGMSTVIYPELAGSYYLNITLMIAVAALISSLYPAWKTLKLNPVEAIRKI